MSLKQLGSDGVHHLLVALGFDLISVGVGAGPLILSGFGWYAFLLVFFTGHSLATGYYAGRERIFDKIRGDHSAGGRWQDFVFVFAVWLALLAVVLAATAVRVA